VRPRNNDTQIKAGVNWDKSSVMCVTGVMTSHVTANVKFTD